MSEAIRADQEATAGRKLLSIVLGVIWAGVLAVSLIGLSNVGMLPEGPDEWTYDWRTFLFSPAAPGPRKDIAIILIDEDSMADYDYTLPVDRGLLATLLRGLDEAHPKAIGLDFIYDRKSDESKTEALIEAMKAVKSPLVFGAIDTRIGSLEQANLKYQEAFIKRTGRDAGHVFFARDIKKLKIGDQIVRYMGERAPGPPYRSSFAQRLAEKSGVVPKEPATSFISWLLPPPGGDLFPLFRVPRHAPGSAPDAVLPESWRSALKDRIVLIGGDFLNRDKHLTPLSIWDSGKVPGVFIQAQILAQLLDGRSIHTLSWQHELLMLAGLAFLGYLFSQQPRFRHDLVLYVSGIVALVLLGIMLFRAYGVIIPSTTLLFSWTLGVTGGHYASRILQRLGFA